MIYLCVSTIGEAEAPALARKLVEEKLVACVNIVPGVRSVYRWKGEIHEDSEVVLLMKIAPVSIGGFEDQFRKLHPYECPELLILPVEEGLKDYFYWVQEACEN